MFGNLTSPNDAGKDRIQRNIGSIGNKVSSSPFGNKVSSSPFRSASPKAKFSPSPFTSGSPNASRSATAVGSQNLSAVFSKQIEKKNTRETGNNMDWPDEDGIPAPSSMKKNFTSSENNLPPVTSTVGKFSNNSSPFKVINNHKVQGKLPNYTYGKTKLETNKFSVEDRINGDQKCQSQNTVTIESLKKDEKKVEATVTKEDKSSTANVDTPVESKDPSADTSNSNHDENKPTRAMRLMKAKRATGAQNLKQSLQAAKVVMQEQKSDAGASDASSRSSLSNKELSSIAKRALKKSYDNMQISSGQEAQRALLSVAAGKEKKTIESGAASERLGMKASRVLAIKNQAKARAKQSSQKGMDIVKTLSTHSNDSSRSRRMEHPAFAGRQVKTNISSAHMLASFHQLKTLQASAKPKQGKPFRCVRTVVKASVIFDFLLTLCFLWVIQLQRMRENISTMISKKHIQMTIR